MAVFWIVVHVLPLDHRVPAVGYLVCETRDKLKSEFFGLAGTEIAQLRRNGVAVTNRVELPLIAYLGDTRTVPIDSPPICSQRRHRSGARDHRDPEDRS